MVTKTPLWNFAEQTDSGSQAQTKTKATTATAQAQLVTSIPVKPPAPQVKLQLRLRCGLRLQLSLTGQVQPTFPNLRELPPRGAKRMPAESLNQDRLSDFPESEASLIASSRPAKAHYCDMLGIFCYKLVTMPVQ